MENFELGSVAVWQHRTIHQRRSYPDKACNMAYLPVHAMPLLLEPCLLCTTVPGMLKYQMQEARTIVGCASTSSIGYMDILRF